MSLNPRNISGSVPPSEALPRHGGAPGAGPRVDGDIAAGARGPLRLHPFTRALERLALFVMGVFFVSIALAVGLGVLVLSLLAFAVVVTFDLLWTWRALIIGLLFAAVIAKIAGLL